MTNVKERRAKLVAALRSGDYTQGQRKLRNHENQFCCLGIACDLFNPTSWVKVKASDDNEIDYQGYRFNTDFDTSTSLLTVDTMRYYGFNAPGGDFFLRHLKDELKEKLELNMCLGEGSSGDMLALSTINDKGAKFDLIADIIESEPKGMFTS